MFIAQKVAEKFDQREVFPTPRADNFRDTPTLDAFKSIIDKLKVDDNIHTFTLNKRLTKNQNLQIVKDDLLKAKKEILKCLSDNIRDQNSEESLVAMFGAFNLKSTEDLDSRLGGLNKNGGGGFRPPCTLIIDTRCWRTR